MGKTGTLPVGIYELGHYGAQPYLESVFLARLAPVKEGMWAVRQIPWTGGRAHVGLMFRPVPPFNSKKLC